jgi:hypothetical protein
MRPPKKYSFWTMVRDVLGSVRVSRDPLGLREGSHNVDRIIVESESGWLRTTFIKDGPGRECLYRPDSVERNRHDFGLA